MSNPMRQRAFPSRKRGGLTKNRPVLASITRAKRKVALKHDPKHRGYNPSWA